MWGVSQSIAVARASLVAFAASSSRVTRRSIRSSTLSLQAEKQYLLRYSYVADVLEKRGPHREGHLGLAQKLVEQGTCLFGGPTSPPGAAVPTGALFIFNDADAAQYFVQNDPYVSNGIVTGHSLEEWTVVVKK